jgi:hypothetical protein
MMIDLTNAFRAALQAKDGWSLGQTQRLLHTVQNSLPGGRVDWEAGNENWGLVLSDKQVVAYVSSLAPLIFIRKDFSDSLGKVADVFGVTCLEYNSIKAFDYKIDRVVLEDFVGRNVSPNFDYSEMSLQDIWFVTVT